MGELARRAPATIDSPWLKTLPPAARYAFHGDAAARAAALPAWGVEFPEEACRAHTRATRASLWLGPDEYLLLDFAAAAAAAAGGSSGAPSRPSPPGTAFDALERAIDALPHALVDVSHRQFALEIRGPHAATILNGACPLDLDLTEFSVGMCTRTVFAKADIVLWRTRADAFHVEVWRSFSGYVTGVLEEIAAEFYLSR